MVDIVQAIQSSFDMAKRLRDLNTKVGEADFKMLLADLLSDLSEAKVQAADLKDTIVRLREENEALRGKLERREEAGPEIHEGAYVFGDKARHYCTGCYDSTGRKSLLTQQKHPFNVFGKWLCPVCKQHIGPGAG